MKYYKRVIAFLLLLAILCTAQIGCAPQAETVGAERVLTDMSGNEVALPAAVTRVHVDWVSGITLVMTLGATNKLLAKPIEFEQDIFAWARMICPDIISVKTNDEVYMGSINPEAVLNLEPDVVITNSQENLDAYKKVGLTAVYVTFNDYETFKESMTIVGAVLGEEEHALAQAYNAYLDSNIAMVKERLADIPESEKKSVYYVDGRFADPYHTVGAGEIQETWITLGGGKLATAADFSGRNIEIAAEKFLEIDPDIILVGAQSQAAAKAALESDPVLCELTAVKEGQVYRLPQGLFPWCRTGPEFAMQMVWSGKFLHPAQFEDIDMIQFARDFYEQFYGTSLADVQIQEILDGHQYPGAD